MREIKFRGKRIDTGEWVYGDLIENQGRFFIYRASSETTLMDDNDRDITVTAIAVDNNTVGQFTGLHDKHGKEIYEGDMLKENTTQSKYIIEWRRDAAFFIMRKNATRQWYDIRPAPHIKIIGNIHDNKKLLERGKK